MPTLNWIGKEKVVNHHLAVSFRTLEKKEHFGTDDGNRLYRFYGTKTQGIMDENRNP